MTESSIDFVCLLIKVHLWLMVAVTQFVVWLIYFAAQGSVYMSGRYWFSLPTFTLGNIIKSEFCFLQNTADSRREAETPGGLHTYCTVQKNKWILCFLHFIFLAKFGFVSYNVRSQFPQVKTWVVLHAWWERERRSEKERRRERQKERDWDGKRKM